MFFVLKRTVSPYVQLSNIFEHKIVTSFLPINFNICYQISDGSFEHPLHMFWLRNKKSIFQSHILIWRHGLTESTINMFLLKNKKTLNLTLLSGAL